MRCLGGLLSAAAFVISACGPECDAVGPHSRCFDDTDCPSGVHCMAGHCGPGLDAGVGRDGAAVAPGPVEYYLITRLTIDDSDAVEMPHTGFDLDGLASGPTSAEGCNHEDFFSDRDLDQNHPPGCAIGTPGCRGGVDNQYPTMINSLQAAVMNMDLRMELQSSINAGRTLYVLAAYGIDSRTSDTDVTLALLVVRGVARNCSGPLAPGAEFVVESRSYVGGDPARPAWTAQARIMAGRLQTILPFDAPFPAPAVDPSRTLGSFREFAASRTRIALDFDTNGTGIRQGNWGAVLDFTEVLDAWGLPDYRSASIAVLSGVVDLRRPCQLSCVDRTNAVATFGDISAAMGFEGLRATIVQTDPPLPDGGCPDAGRDR